MGQGKTIIVVLVTLSTGFAGGFILRPMILPIQQTDMGTAAAPPTPLSSEARWLSPSRHSDAAKIPDRSP